jgi:hypothetical protein
VSDTPRTEAEVNRQKCWSDDLITVDANFACQLERELNSANAEVDRLTAKVAQLYEGAEEQRQRIKRLEEVGDEVVINYVNSLSAFEMWRKAKEAKP